MEHCSFCKIARDGSGAAIAWHSGDLVVFADHRPIRAGHMQIIPRAHFEVFDDLPGPLLADIVQLGQKIAKAQKRLYGVTRVGFVFTGNEVPHVHAHLIPLHSADDVTSARYSDPGFAPIDLAQQQMVAAQLREALGE